MRLAQAVDVLAQDSTTTIHKKKSASKQAPINQRSRQQEIGVAHQATRRARIRRPAPTSMKRTFVASSDLAAHGPAAGPVPHPCRLHRS